jgi:hypothetical protein
VSISQAAGEVGRLVWVWHTQQLSLHAIYTKDCDPAAGALGTSSGEAGEALNCGSELKE